MYLVDIDQGTAKIIIKERVKSKYSQLSPETKECRTNGGKGIAELAPWDRPWSDAAAREDRRDRKDRNDSVSEALVGWFLFGCAKPKSSL